MIEIKKLTQDNWREYSASLQELESTAVYPYGTDSFRINHGESYFSFVERLGEPLFHVALEGSRVVACAAGVLRTLPSFGRAWYLCDLKVHPEFRGRRLTTQLFKKNFFRNYLRCGRGYAISMNPAQGENRVIRILQQLPYIPIAQPHQLHIFSLAFDQMKSVSVDLEALVGPISYLSLQGKKDLIMSSTGKPLKLLHVQHGPLAERQLDQPVPDAVHMICALQSSPLDRLLSKSFEFSASASIVAHRMASSDWSFILTSDI